MGSLHVIRDTSRLFVSYLRNLKLQNCSACGHLFTDNSLTKHPRGVHAEFYSTMSTTKLSATYNAPDETKDLTLDLPLVLSDQGTVEDKTTYLTTLRTQIANLQDNVNAFLTQKMEDDNAAASAAQNDAKDKAQLRKEQLEVDRYGEEDVEDA